MGRSAALWSTALSATLVAVALLAPGAEAQTTHDEPVLPEASPGTPRPSGGGVRGGEVLVVGDSLEVLTGPYIQQYLPGVEVTVNAEGGYNSYQLYDLFRESYGPEHSVVVFDAGTNDNPAYPQILAENLAKVAATVGDACMVVPSIHGLVVDGVGNRGKNQVVYSFAASRPGTQVPDWAGTVADHPELMQPDDLHPTPEGADFRARLIAQAVTACLTPLIPEPVEEKRAPPPPPRKGLLTKFVEAFSEWAARTRKTLANVLAPVDPDFADGRSGRRR
jgi:hypothetical protein